MHRPMTLHLLSTGLVGWLLLACSQQPEPPDLDPMLGRHCFASHQATLPPGSQYEGFEVKDDQVLVKVMNGVTLVTVTCPLLEDAAASHSETPRQPTPPAAGAQ